MMNRVSLEPAFILHSHPYRNTSLILELLTENYGRVSVLARSARGLKSRYKGKCQLFFPMLVSWSGRGELKLLGDLELSESPFLLEGDVLLCGFYLNELVLRLLQREDPCRYLFLYYKTALSTLESSLIITLRCFEKRMLHVLGYGLPLRHDLDATKHYQYVPDNEFLICEPFAESCTVFSGESLIAIRDEIFDSENILRDAKRLMRLAISRLLGDNPLKSRLLLS